MPWFDWRRKRFWLLVAVVVYTLLGFFALPWLVERQFVKTFSETGRTAGLERVRTNPYLLTLDVEGAVIRDSDEHELLALERLFVNFQLSSIFRWAATFKTIRLEGLNLAEERFEGADTRFARLLSDLAEAPEAPPDDEAPPTEDENPPRLIIGEFSLAGGQLEILDRTAGDYSARFGPIDVEVFDIRTLPDNEGKLAVSVTFGGGVVEWQGDLNLIPFRSRGHLALHGGRMEEVFRYADHFLPFATTVSGAEIELDYRVDLASDGDQVTIEGLSGEVSDIAVIPDAIDEPVFTAAAITLADGRLAWPGATAGVQEVAINGMTLDAERREDGTVNLMDLIPASPEGGDAPIEMADNDTTPASWQISVDRVVVPDARIDVADRTVSPAAEVALTDLAVTLNGFDNRDGTAMPLELRTDLSTGGVVRYQGELTLLPALSTRGELELESVALPPVQPYVNPLVRMTLNEGTLSLQAEAVHGPAQRLELAGSMRVDALDVADAVRSEQLLAWDSLSLSRFELDLSGGSLQTSELKLNGLYGRLHIAEDRSTNIGDLLVEAPPEKAGAEGDGGTGSDPMTIAIGGIRLDDTRLDFSDFSLPLPFATEIRSMDGDISTLSTASANPADVDLEGQVNEYGSALIDGTINAWAPTEKTDIRMTFRNLEMARLTPYTVQFAGYEIDGGRLDMDLAYRLDARKMAGDNNIVIREIDLGDKVEHPGAGSLPLGLAVALLKDANGVIDVDVPVEGDLDDPKFRIGGVIWKAIGNLVTKAVTAPFRLLGNLVGVDDKDFGTLAFAPGRANVSPPDREKLAKLGEAMLQRPALAIEVNGVYAESLDRQALQQLQLEQRIEAREAEHPGDTDELSTVRQRRVLEALFAETFPGESLEPLVAEHTPTPADDDPEPLLDEPAYLAALEQRLAGAQAVSRADLETLAETRAQAVVEALRASQPDAGLNVATGSSGPVEPGEDGRVPLELSVEAGADVADDDPGVSEG